MRKKLSELYNDENFITLLNLIGTDIFKMKKALEI